MRVAYRSQGLDSWQYNLGGEGVARVRDFNLKMRTNFPGIDFPENTLSPTFKSRRGMAGIWPGIQGPGPGFPIALKMPEKLQPGLSPAKLACSLPYHFSFSSSCSS